MCVCVPFFGNGFLSIFFTGNSVYQNAVGRVSRRLKPLGASSEPPRCVIDTHATATDLEDRRRRRRRRDVDFLLVDYPSLLCSLEKYEREREVHSTKLCTTRFRLTPSTRPPKTTTMRKTTSTSPTPRSNFDRANDSRHRRRRRPRKRATQSKETTQKYLIGKNPSMLIKSANLIIKPPVKKTTRKINKQTKYLPDARPSSRRR